MVHRPAIDADSVTLDELLRSWDADAAPLAEPTRAQARHRLLNTIKRTERHPGPAPSRRHALRLAAAAVVTMAVAGTAVVITADGADEGGRAGMNAPRIRNAAAVTVLKGAAAFASEHEKPVAPRDDQFIYSKRVVKETERKTGEVKTYVDKNWDSVDGSKRSLTMELGRVIWEEPMGKGGVVWPPRTRMSFSGSVGSFCSLLHSRHRHARRRGSTSRVVVRAAAERHDAQCPRWYSATALNAALGSHGMSG